ncbi:carbohydrate ABC transporter permease [Oscillibacter ruminantium]|nr:sugar ABC transporter permease [Oscillibacter valericigenes]
MKTTKPKKLKSVRYSKYGYWFILPFFIVYTVFSLWPLISTFYYSLFAYTTRNLKETITFTGLGNYLKLLGLADGEKAYFLKYLGNTLRIWVFNFIPQIALSLLAAAWLTDSRVRLRGKGAYKVLIYMPNIITAASISLLFYAFLSQYGPLMSVLRNAGLISQNSNIMSSTWGTSLAISFILLWMWYGNTTLLLISGMMGINASLYEAADLDGASTWQKFTRITLPLLKPILVYVLVTSAIGGLQLYDIPALFNASGYIGLPDDTSTTVTMYIMRLHSTDTGRAAAVSIMLFLITVLISLFLFRAMRQSESGRRHKKAEGGGQS